MNKLASTLHEVTHQVPGVPAHGANPAHHNTRHSHSAPSQGVDTQSHQAPERHQKPPRVLVAWQNWIAQRVGRNG